MLILKTSEENGVEAFQNHFPENFYKFNSINLIWDQSIMENYLFEYKGQWQGKFSFLDQATNNWKLQTSYKHLQTIKSSRTKFFPYTKQFLIDKIIRCFIKYKME